MKFSRNLPRNQVPEWANSYIKYKALKKLIKIAAESAKQGQVADTAEFFFSLDRNLEDVDNFYNKKYADAARRLKLLKGQYGKSFESPLELDKDEVEDLVEALLELRATLRKLQWYGEVNRRGFVKITKKLDKKVPDHKQRGYVESKVDLKPFATNVSLAAFINTANDWLLKAGEIKFFDDNSSEHSSHSLSRASTKAMLKLPESDWDTLDQAIRDDVSPVMTRVLSEANISQEMRQDVLYQRLILSLLQRAIACRSRDCIVKLLDLVEVLEDSEDINKRNCIHRFVISLSRSQQGDYSSDGSDIQLDSPYGNGNYITPAAPPTLSGRKRVAKEMNGTRDQGQDDNSVSILTVLLDHLYPSQRPALKARDSFGRLGLHYAAQYGFIAIVQVITKRMKDWGQFEIPECMNASFLPDFDGQTPLHFSVIGGHLNTTKALLEAGEWQDAREQKTAGRSYKEASGEILSIATKANFIDIVRLLVLSGCDVNHQDEQGETALHVTARFGFVDCAKILLCGSDGTNANLEITENTFGWTALFTACVDGNLAIAELLIEAGADLLKKDLSGWTAGEHAALRGHIEIAKTIANHIPEPESGGSSENQLPPVTSSLSERKSNGGIGTGVLRTSEPVKSFGHRYLTDDTMILVSLGTMDMRKELDAVKLDRIPLAEAHLTQLDTALSVVVWAAGASGEPSIVDLPIQENISTEPIAFMAKNATGVKIMFDIVPTYAGTKDRIVGRGVALLSSIKPSIGSKRITLQGDLTVPIMASHNLDVIGSVTFNFLVITPFKHSNMLVTEDHTYWKSMASTMVIGHRGLGKNQASKKSLQLGENTIQSFITAANLGASYVEFDVQLTKDHVPVIYHDFLVSETGIDAPVHTLTLEQFMHVSDGRTPRTSRASSPANTNNSSFRGGRGVHHKRHRSLSPGNRENTVNNERSERMKHTRDFKIKGFKGNSRGNFIQAPFTTLEEMFKKLPEHIGFNIEMKYPMLFESEEQEMDTYAVELNSFVDTVLTKVYDLGTGRNVIFSSFNPDICLLLSLKQPSIPILFLTDAGVSKVGDIRASSLQEAIRFASRWNLLGIVSTAEPLVLCPRLVRVVKESGLVCVSYGMLNNDPEKVKLQVQEGIDAVIVDSVLAIRKGLTGADGAPLKNSQPSVQQGELMPLSGLA